MITSNEIKNKTFDLSLRGYNKGQVDSYLLSLAAALDEMNAKNQALLRENAGLQAALTEMKENEDAIRRALVNSQNAAAKVVEDAKQRGAELELLAREKCGAIIAEFRDHIRAERERLNLLRAQVANFKARIFELYQTHIQTVEGITDAVSEEDWDMTPTDATRTVLALLKGDFERRTLKDELEAEKLDQEIDSVFDRIMRNKKTDDHADPNT